LPRAANSGIPGAPPLKSGSPRSTAPLAGAHTDGAQTAIKRFKDGYHFATLINDVNLLARASRSALAEARGEGKVEGAKSY